MQKYLSSAVQFTLLFLPLFALPIIPFGYETPKVLIFEAIVTSLFFFLLFTNEISIQKPLIKGLLGFVFLVITTIVFFNSDTIWFNNPIRLQGVFLYGICMLWAVCSSTIKLKKFSPNFTLASFLSVCLSGLFLVHPVTERAIGTLGEPNSYGGTAILLGIVTIFSWKDKKYKKIVWGLVFCLAFLSVILSASRSSLLACMLFSLLFVLWQKKILLKKMIVIAMIFTFCSLLLPFFVRTNSWEDRSMIWQTAVVSGFSSPLIGHGFGNITSALQKGAVKLENHVRFQFVDSSHNSILDWWVQGGVVGVVTFLYFIVYGLRNAIDREMVQEIMLLIVSLFLMLFNPVSIAVLALFWWVIGQSFRTEKG